MEANETKGKKGGSDLHFRELISLNMGLILCLFLPHFNRKMKNIATALPPITSKEVQIIFKPGFRTWTVLKSVD